MHSGEALIKIKTWSSNEEFAKAIFKQALEAVRRTRDVAEVEVTLEPRWVKVDE